MTYGASKIFLAPGKK